MTKTIPATATLYKEGLYLVEGTTKMGSIKWEIYAAEDYFFYDITQAENYTEKKNENGEKEMALKEPKELAYSRYMIMPKDDEYLTNNIIAVPVSDELRPIYNLL